MRKSSCYFFKRTLDTSASRLFWIEFARTLRFCARNPCYILKRIVDTSESCCNEEDSQTPWDSVPKTLAISWKLCLIQASPSWNAEISPSNWDSASQCLAMSWKVHMIQESPAWNEENSFTRRMSFRELKTLLCLQSCFHISASHFEHREPVKKLIFHAGRPC